MATPHPSTASLRSGCHLPLKVKALSNIIAKNGGSKPPPYGKYHNSKKQFLILNSINSPVQFFEKGVRGRNLSFKKVSPPQ